MTAKSILIYYQAVLNLTGQSDDPVILRGEAMDQDDYLLAKNNNVRTQLHFMWMLQQQLAYLFENLEVGNARLQDMDKEKRMVDAVQFYVPNLLMHMCLTAIAMIKSTGRRKYRVQARKYTKILESWVKQKVLNVQHKYMLVLADEASMKAKDYHEVKEKFDCAILTATKSGFKQDAALAKEMAGRYWLSKCNKEEKWIAIDYLTDAQLLYEEWGAKAKVAQMESKYAFLVTEDLSKSGSRGSLGLRGRPRFTKKPSKMHEEFNPMKSTTGGEPSPSV
eukprot:CAMPEP_0116847916 /NCGR_PEP_ID=MMETSP0418-20121206/14696_1 /TAXON_ID=1158023 /ORGANISM="Astrosyne radiata, Strain 13vi08-1A" /LENGTH=277 /DNA_ID=CAMNT_0004479407 /DNA_START=193 /DNA_END=1026 /DNA_ORIENTATION=-